MSFKAKEAFYSSSNQKKFEIFPHFRFDLVRIKLRSFTVLCLVLKNHDGGLNDDVSFFLKWQVCNFYFK